MHISNAISISGRTSGGYVSRLVSAYVKRVTDDGGVVEAKECVKAAFIELGAAPVGFVGLLNTYSGAAAAYSLRQLSTTYSGDAIRVRRSSDNTETNIGFVNNELDTSTLATFCSGTNGFVTMWYDQSGNGNDATQGTAASQPQIVSSGSVITQGSKPSIRFDGSDDHFDTSQNNPFTFTGGLSVIHASYKNSTGYKSYETILSAGTTDDVSTNYNKTIALGYGNSTFVNPLPTITTDIWAPSGIQYNGTISTNQRHLIGYYISNWSTHRSTGLSNLRFNGSDVSTKSYNSINPTGLNTNPLAIGVFDELLTNSFFGGDIQEIIAYASDKNSDRIGIETNINDFYSIYP